MSEASSEHSAGGTRYTGEQLVQRLQRKAGNEAERFSLTSHLAAGRVLVRLRDALLAGEALSQRSEMALLCVGIALRRRWLSTQNQMSEDDSADTKRDAEDSLELLRKSVKLIFVLLCLVEKRRAEADADEAARQIEAFRNTPVWSVVAPRSRKRPREGEGEEEEGEAGEEGEEEGEQGAPTGGEDGEGGAERGWARALRLTAADVARMALTVGAAQIGTTGSEDGNDDDELALLYFRSEAARMATRLLMPSPSADFVTLGTKRGDESVSRAKRLLAITQAGESEAGQSILRDMVLSWLLPPRLVGVRRGLLLSRATSTAAGVDWPLAVQRAHDVAMSGCEFIWENGTDELERMCCLLTGLAILTTKGGDDPIRKLDAFKGRVSLPWFETAAPSDDKALRLTLVPEARKWIVFVIEPNGSPRVVSALTGFEGMCESVLIMLS
jgi:hypothetical protein